MAHQFERIAIGIDPGTATTGYGVVASTNTGDFELLACGVFRTDPQTEMAHRLLEVFTDFKRLVNEFQPSEVAIEKLFFGRNVTTAISVGQARGVILLASALNNLPIFEYTPAEVKQAICGYGNAEKKQIQEMVRQLLSLHDIPRPDDAADGVAIAVCHLQMSTYQMKLDQSIRKQ